MTKSNIEKAVELCKLKMTSPTVSAVEYHQSVTPRFVLRLIEERRLAIELLKNYVDRNEYGPVTDFLREADR